MEKTCKAAVTTGVGKIEIQEFPIPEIDPNGDDGLLKVEMCSVCGTDPKMYNGKAGVEFPLIQGHEFVGRIEKLGKRAQQLKGIKEGDRVVVEVRWGCGVCKECLTGNYNNCKTDWGYGFKLPCKEAPYLFGAFSQYVYLPPRAVIHKVREDVSAKALSLVCAVIGNSVRWTRIIGGVTVGDVVVIIGPGPQGLGACAVAKDSGADKVIVAGLAKDKHRLEFAKKMGADYTVNVEEESLDEVVAKVTNGRGADVVEDVSGDSREFNHALKLARMGGTIVVPGMYGAGKLDQVELDLIPYKELVVKGAHTHNISSVPAAIKLIESGKFDFDGWTEKVFPLEETETAIKWVRGDFEGDLPIKVAIDPWM